MAMWCSRCVNHSSSQSRLQQPCRETHMKSKKKLWHVVIQDMVSWESPSPCDSCVCTCTLASVLPHMFVSHRRLLSQSSQLQWLSVLFRCATSLSLLIPDCSNRAENAPGMETRPRTSVHRLRPWDGVENAIGDRNWRNILSMMITCFAVGRGLTSLSSILFSTFPPMICFPAYGRAQLPGNCRPKCGGRQAPHASLLTLAVRRTPSCKLAHTPNRKRRRRLQQTQARPHASPVAVVAGPSNTKKR